MELAHRRGYAGFTVATVLMTGRPARRDTVASPTLRPPFAYFSVTQQALYQIRGTPTSCGSRADAAFTKLCFSTHW